MIMKAIVGNRAIIENIVVGIQHARISLIIAQITLQNYLAILSRIYIAVYGIKNVKNLQNARTMYVEIIYVSIN